MEPIHRLIPALNIECPRTLNALGTTDLRLRHCRLGPRQTKAMRWKTPPHVPAKRTPDRSVPSPSLFDVLSDTLGHDGPEAQSHSASPREADSMSQRAQSPAAQSPAAQWLNAPSEAHPGSCRPCWFTAKGKGCHRNGCLFCHKPHDTADVKHLRHPGGRIRQRVAMRKGRDDSCVQSEPVKCHKSKLPCWPLSDFLVGHYPSPDVLMSPGAMKPNLRILMSPGTIAGYVSPETIAGYR